MFLREPKSKTLRLQPGVVRFVIPALTDAGTDAEWFADLIIVKLKIEELEAKHKIAKQDDGTLKAEADFLEELSTAVTELGCPRCTPTMARQIWIAVAQAFNTLEKKFRRELARVTK